MYQSEKKFRLFAGSRRSRKARTLASPTARRISFQTTKTLQNATNELTKADLRT